MGQVVLQDADGALEQVVLGGKQNEGKHEVDERFVWEVAGV